MTTKTLLSLATVSLLAFAAKAYTVETTNSWFSVNAENDYLTTNWSGATPTREKGAKVIDVDTGANNPAFYTPAQSQPSATRYRVTGKMKVTLNAGVPGNNVFGDDRPKAALVAASVGGDNKWYAWHLKSASAGEWVAMNGATATLTDGKEYDITIEFTSSGITYYVDGTALTHGDSSTTVLSNEGGMSLTKVGLAGYGSFGDFGALGFETFEVTITATGDTLSALKTAMGITGEINAAALNEKGANGLTKWESIVLGLPNASTVPYTAPVQTASGDTLGFTIGNANVEAAYATGTAVKVDVYEYNPATGECAATPVEGETQGTSSNGYTATVTPVSSGVKYYKIKITFQK